MIDVAPNYPAPEKKTLSLVFDITSEFLYIHKEHDLSAHIYKMAMGITAAQIGVAVMGQEFLATPAIFEDKKGILIKTERFGELSFPGDFHLVGEL